MDLEIILLITIPADGIFMYLLAWFKHYLCILAINKYNNENKLSFGEAYIYKLPGLVMFENGCCPSIDKALQCNFD